MIRLSSRFLQSTASSEPVQAYRHDATRKNIPTAGLAGQHKRAAVKVIDPRGNEVMRVLHLEGEVRYG